MIKGISLYTGFDDYKIEDIKAFLDRNKNKPIDFIFTSFHISESLNPDIMFLINELSNTNIKLVVDFSKKTYDLFTFNDTIIPRLDYGFSYQNIIEMTNNHEIIELNASIVNIDLLLKLKVNNVDFNKLRVSFNFYPNKYTGMSYEDVENKIKLFYEFNLAVIIYIPGINKRPPMYMGLPTIEAQREQDLLTNLNEAVLLGVDGVCVGDAIITDEELDILLSFKEFDTLGLILDITLESNLDDNEIEILKEVHTIRCDIGDYMVRSSTTRGRIVEPHNTYDVIKPNTVVINNSNLKRYMGEVWITKKEINNNGGLNVVGKVSIKPTLIKGGSKVKFRF